MNTTCNSNINNKYFLMGDFNMRNKLALGTLISISILATGCGSSKIKTQPVSNTQYNVNDSNDNKQEPNTTTTPKATTSPKTIISPTNSNYLNYTGSWVSKNNLVDDFKYGISVNISVDKYGNIKGTVSDSSENLSHISNVDIKGKIKDNKFIFNFDEDGWGHSGTINLDFKINTIVLTINYGPNSSKDNLWGIGEGKFTLINSNTKVNRTLNNLKDGGLQVIQTQCFLVNLENYGSVKFISGLKRENSNDNVNFYLVNDRNNVLYKFPDFYGNAKGMFTDIEAVSFSDVNKDGLKDIIVIANYSINGKSTKICSIYFQKGKEFINNKNFDDKINNSPNNKSVAAILKYAKGNLIK